MDELALSSPCLTSARSRRCSSYAEQRRWIEANVARRVKLPQKPESSEVRFLDPVEIRALADAAVSGPYQAIDRALYLTAAMTGLRQGELVALRGMDVDWPAARIRVRQNYVLGEFGTPKSRRSTRSVSMADEVAGELDRLSKAAGLPQVPRLCSPIPSPGARWTRRRYCAAITVRSRRRRWASHTAFTTCATRSGQGWLRRA